MTNWQWGKQPQSDTRPHDTNSSGTTSSNQSFYNQKPSNEEGIRQGLISFLKLCLLVAVGVVMWLNVQPYIGMLTALLADQVGHPVVQFMLRLPLIGWVLDLISDIFLSVMGFFLWAGFQLVELMPSVLKSSSGLKRMIYGFMQVKAIAINNDDPAFVKNMKLEHNRKPMTWIWKAYVAAAIAYLIDFAFCILYYPPIQGGMQNIGIFLRAPSMDQIDFRNLALSIITLISVEVAVWLWMWVDEGKGYMGKQPR